MVELCLTDYKEFKGPLFQAAFLGEKWPGIDFYVELNNVRGKRPYFLVQSKATATKLAPDSTKLTISTKKKDIEQLLRLPGPTYIFGVHEPSMRVFARSVHKGLEVKAITQIPLTHELTRENLQILHREVREFWSTTAYKPTTSEFA